MKIVLGSGVTKLLFKMRIEGVSLAAVRKTPVWEKMPGTGNIAQCCQVADYSSAKLKGAE
jgi:hypothetical protein